MRVQTQSKHEEAGKCEKAPREQNQTHYTRTARTFAAASSRKDLAKRTRKWPTENVYWNLTVYGRTPGLVVFHWLRPRSTVDRSSITSFVIQSSEVYFVGRASHGAHYTTTHSMQKLLYVKHSIDTSPHFPVHHTSNRHIPEVTAH